MLWYTRWTHVQRIVLIPLLAFTKLAILYLLTLKNSTSIVNYALDEDITKNENQSEYR